MVAKKVDAPANARRMGFSAEPAPDPWSSLTVMNMMGERQASAFRVMQVKMQRSRNPEAYEMEMESCVDKCRM